MIDTAIEEINSLSSNQPDGSKRLRLSVPTIHCGGCISKVESTLIGLKSVVSARVNLTGKYVDIIWHNKPDNFINVLGDVGHDAHIARKPENEEDTGLKKLVRATAVAGFAASNIMLLSVAVWSGASDQYARLFHGVSALIAFPALLYSGQPFFISAWRALRNGKTNMDVPIVIGVVLAFGMSVYDTIIGEHAVYFDASITLLFFLLIGRTLDHFMREKIHDSISSIANLAPVGAIVLIDGKEQYMLTEDLEVGMHIRIPPEQRIPVNGQVQFGNSEIDSSLTSGESTPLFVGPGTQVLAGTLNLSSELHIQAISNAEGSFLSQTVAAMESAASSKTAYRDLSDRMASWFAPFVHIAAFLSFCGAAISGAGWHQSLTIAIAVLIITCPCALGLAAPIVQVIAARKLFDSGALISDGVALEKLADTAFIVFDKTGTLTKGSGSLAEPEKISPDLLTLAAGLAAHSHHPFSRSIVRAAHGMELEIPNIQDVDIIVGAGLEAYIGGKQYRLGKAGWASHVLDKGMDDTPSTAEHLILSCELEPIASFYIVEELQVGAFECVELLRKQHIGLTIISGDQEARVADVAAELGIDDYHAGCNPEDKLRLISEISNDVGYVTMVGDGLNDTPAMAAANFSIAPSTAADISRNGAGLVYLNDNMKVIVGALDIAKFSVRLIRQNFALAIIYNLIAVPLAVFGFVTPLIAAISMSASSIVVIANSYRIKFRQLNTSKGSV